MTVKSDVTETLKVKEVPKNNPIDLVLQKIDAETKPIVSVFLIQRGEMWAGCLILKDTRSNRGLHEGWQTGGTVRFTRLAFNLWNGYVEPEDERMSTPYEIFNCGYAPYFYEAIRQRYPEYCRELPPVKEKSTGKER